MDAQYSQPITLAAFEVQWGDTTQDEYAQTDNFLPKPCYGTNTATGTGYLYGRSLVFRMKQSDVTVAEEKNPTSTAVGWVALPELRKVFSVERAWFSLVKGTPALREYHFVLTHEQPFVG